VLENLHGICTAGWDCIWRLGMFEAMADGLDIEAIRRVDVAYGSEIPHVRLVDCGGTKADEM